MIASDEGHRAQDAQISVCLADSVIGISARTVVTEPTIRPAIAILWSISGRPFVVRAKDGQPWRGNAAVIAPDKVRALTARDTDLISLNIEVARIPHVTLTTWTAAGGFVPVKQDRLADLGEAARLAILSGNDRELVSLTAEAFGRVFGRPISTMPTQRILHALDSLTSEQGELPNLIQTAAALRLSPTRLSHLAREELGCSWRSYLVWRKYLRAVSALGSEAKLADIALAAGFYDQAHMAHAFRRLFGFPASTVRRRMRITAASNI